VTAIRPIDPGYVAITGRVPQKTAPAHNSISAAAPRFIATSFTL
jgi:hypothetical protein